MGGSNPKQEISPLFELTSALEVEMGTLIGTPSALGERIKIKDVPEHLFGMVLLNLESAVEGYCESLMY